MAIDNTTGEVKLVRGSGPPMLTVERDVIEIAMRVYLVDLNVYSCSLPMPGEVIGIDLTRRTVRIQLFDQKEYLYSAELKGGEHRFVFSTAELAKQNAVKTCQTAVTSAEKYADDAIRKLEDAKSKWSKAMSWEPKE